MIWIGGFQGNDPDKIRGHFLHTHALPDDFRRQLRLCELFAVLSLNLGDVRVRADFEGQLDRDMAVVAARAIEVDEIINPGQLDLDRAGDRIRDDLGARARIIGIDLNDRRSNLRELGDGQELDGQQPHDHDHNGDDRCQDRSINEDVRCHSYPCFGSRRRRGGRRRLSDGTAFTGAPGPIFISPLTTTRSPAFKPASISH